MRASRLTHEDMLHDPGKAESQTTIVPGPDFSGAPSQRSFDAIDVALALITVALLVTACSVTGGSEYLNREPC
jgi:hypothetical protein